MNNKGFTKMEILVVVVLVGLVLSVAGFLLANARKDNRDIKRLADVEKIRDALEFYFYACNRYPASISTGSSISGEECGGGVYLSVVPRDPRGVDYKYVPCVLESTWRCEEGINNAESYLLEYTLEGNSAGISAGKHAANPTSLY